MNIKAPDPHCKGSIFVIALHCLILMSPFYMIDAVLTEVDLLVFTFLEGFISLILPIYLVSCGGTATRQLLVAHGQHGLLLVSDSNVFFCLKCDQFLSVFYETVVDVL